MTAKTHMAGGIALACTMTTFFHLYEPRSLAEATVWGGAFVVPAVVGSLAPDIDHHNSKAANTNLFTKLLAIIIRLTCGHRGMLHSPFFVFLLTLIFGVVYRFYLPLAVVGEAMLGFIIGYISHLVVDMLNTQGIPLLFPFVWENGRPKKVHGLGLKENGIAEFVIDFLLSGISVYLIYNIVL